MDGREVPLADGDPREVGRAQRGGLGDLGDDDGNAERVGLELHQPLVDDRAAVGAELRQRLAGGGFLQAYQPTTGRERGRFEDGRIAIVENRFGAGRTLLVGTHPGAGYFRTSSADNRRYFAEVFAWTGRTQQVAVSDNLVQARLHEGMSGRVLWLLNPTRERRRVTVTIDGRPARLGAAFWAGADADAAEDMATVPPRDVLVLRLA